MKQSQLTGYKLPEGTFMRDGVSLVDANMYSVYMVYKDQFRKKYWGYYDDPCLKDLPNELKQYIIKKRIEQICIWRNAERENIDWNLNYPTLISKIKYVCDSLTRSNKGVIL